MDFFYHCATKLNDSFVLLTVVQLFHCEDGQDGFPDDLRCGCGLLAHGSCPFPLRASGAVWLGAHVLAAAS